MAFENLSFEDIGGSAGQADQWTLSSVGTAESVALFDTTPEAKEDFEEGWGNDFYIYGFLPVHLDTMNFVGPPVNQHENFEQAWTPASPPIP